MASLGVQQTRATGHYSLTYHQGGLLTPLCCLSWISVNLELWFEELIITGISRSFVSKVILETRNSKKLGHSPLCCTEDISLITFQFEWLLEVGAVLWHRGHTHTKKMHDSGPWHIQRKHVTVDRDTNQENTWQGNLTVLGNEKQALCSVHLNCRGGGQTRPKAGEQNSSNIHVHTYTFTCRHTCTQRLNFELQ